MNPKKLVKLSNTIGTISILLLVYWVFTFISIQVFGLKVFRENMTETFYMSVLGILALMIGALIINVMFNLTRIAQKHNQDVQTEKSNNKKTALFLLSFPVLFLLLFAGDYLTSRKKEKVLIQSAQAIIENNKINSDKLINYEFTEEWILKTEEILTVFSKTDKHFPQVSVLVKDTIGKSPAILGFTRYYHGNLKDTILPKKIDFIRQTTQVERDYLNKVFNNNLKELRYSTHDGSYELFYPFTKDNKTIVLYFSDYQQYGKIGS